MDYQGSQAGVCEIFGLFSTLLTLLLDHCQVLTSHVCLVYVHFRPEERAALHLLYVLYACVFWRVEAGYLAFQTSLEGLAIPPPE